MPPDLWEAAEDMARRRGQRKGNLIEKSGSWILRWYEDSRNICGQKVRHRQSMVIAQAVGKDGVTRKQAERIAWDRVLSKLDAQVMRPAAMITFQQFVTLRFIPDHVETQCRPGGKVHYEYCLSHITPAFGKEKLRDVSRTMIQDFLNEKRRAKLSPQTVRHLKNCLSAIFRHARRCEIWAGDLPTADLLLPKIVTQEKRTLTVEQAARLIRCLPSGKYSVLGALVVSTGLRISEAAGIRWRRIDFENLVITVAETYSREHGFQPVKSDAGFRLVPLPAALAFSVAALRNGADDDDPVFKTKRGNPVDKRTSASKILKPAAKRAGVPWCSWHILRHTNATWTDPKLTEAERIKILGHSSKRMTLHYTHPTIVRAKDVCDEIAEGVVAEPDGKERVN